MANANESWWQYPHYNYLTLWLSLAFDFSTSNEMDDQRRVSHFFFYEILVAASVECSSRIVEVASCYEISRARNFFATFC